ncbi:MAG: ATP-binding protein [Lachnospiraceae bacterium]|nr:ATP-binding protein [Lachnospiraceae bacterium]
MANKHATELQYLNHYYEQDGSQLIVFYGQKNMNMTQMLLDFCQSKPSYYYVSRACSEREQLYIWGAELKEKGAFLPDYPAFTDLFYAITEKKSKKKIIVIEEFQNIVKQSASFMKELISFMHSKWDEQPVMVILCSTLTGWVENNLVSKIGEAAYEITGFVKMKELGFHEVTRRFPECSKEYQIETYALLGGNPGLWHYFDESLSVKENICRNILKRDAYLHEEAIRIVGSELRETNVYHTILSAIASGKQKLNDLHIHTGFSRAKISVYLKNLMELELVEKVFSYDSAGRENTQKGVYRISNHLVQFYFRYMYPNASRLKTMQPEEFYETYIAPTFRSFVAPYYVLVCREYLDRLNEKKKLPINYSKIGEWVGKVGTIDILAQDEDGNTICCLCNWEKPMMLYDDYEWLLFCMEKAKLTADHICLFSATRFDEKLILEAKVKKALKLLDLSAI